MFIEMLLSLFRYDALFYWAITIDDYRQGFEADIELWDEEFMRICRHWNKALRIVDWKKMAYEVELFDVIDAFDLGSAEYSGWELEIPGEEDQPCLGFIYR